MIHEQITHCKVVVFQILDFCVSSLPPRSIGIQNIEKRAHRIMNQYLSAQNGYFLLFK